MDGRPRDPAATLSGTCGGFFLDSWVTTTGLPPNEFTSRRSCKYMRVRIVLTSGLVRVGC